MQERTGTHRNVTVVDAPETVDQPSTEAVNPRSEEEQVSDIERLEARMAKVSEVDDIATRERERIQQYQMEKYGELVQREDEPLYGLDPIEGGEHEFPKEEPGPANSGGLNLTWAIVFGGLFVFLIFAGILFYSIWLRDPNTWGTVKSVLSPDPFK